MKFTVFLVLCGGMIALLSASATTLKKMNIFVDAFISIADETFFVLLCTYCVVPLVVYNMHTLLLRQDAPEHQRHLRQLESSHMKEIIKERNQKLLGDEETTCADTRIHTSLSLIHI